MMIFTSGQWRRYLGGGLDAVQTGQADVHQNDVRPFLAAYLHGFGAGFRFTAHRELIAVAQDGLDAIAHDFVIVHQEHLKRHVR